MFFEVRQLYIFNNTEGIFLSDGYAWFKTTDVNWIFVFVVEQASQHI